ncbi:MAG: glycosyltransferase family 39 protein [Sedimentisphaerales bacterium]
MKKEDSLNQSNEALSFWLCAGLLAVLLASVLARDIDRPFYGLHSWADAAAAWRAKAYLKYDLKYTKGLAVWAVGEPPGENPNRSLDHPQLGLFLPALDMLVFGINERSMRIGGIIRAVICLLLFLRILRGLLDDKTALLTGLLFVIFPITGFFGTLAWLMPVHLLNLLAVWCYLVILGSIKDGPEARALHKWGLGLSLFFILQLRWEGLFYAMAIGVHYVFRCIRRKQFPEKTLLAILIIAPLSSLVLNFVVMAAGHGWDLQKIWSLYQWRASKGEMPEFVWGLWFAKMWEFAVTNFTLPVLITAIAYLTFGQLLVFTVDTAKKTTATLKRRFPQFWLFLMPALFQLFILKGALWKHQYWESPLVPFIAIATALAIMLLADFLGKINRRAANIGVVLLVGIIFVSCTMGLNHYYNIRWQSPNKIKMFKDLNRKIPPDKALLSFEHFVVNQHPVKGPHYRPEIAWYLDREIVVAYTLADIEKMAKTGRFPYYLMPGMHRDSRAAAYLPKLRNELEKRYKMVTYVPGDPGQAAKDGKPLRAWMPSYFIFDLNSSIAGS